jgi:hypothetical protein
MFRHKSGPKKNWRTYLETHKEHYTSCCAFIFSLSHSSKDGRQKLQTTAVRCVRPSTTLHAAFPGRSIGRVGSFHGHRGAPISHLLTPFLAALQRIRLACVREIQSPGPFVRNQESAERVSRNAVNGVLQGAEYRFNILLLLIAIELSLIYGESWGL